MAPARSGPCFFTPINHRGHEGNTKEFILSSLCVPLCPLWFNLLPLAPEHNFRACLHERGQAGCFLLNAATHGRRKFLEPFNGYNHATAARRVRPGSHDLSVDENHGGNPTLIPPDPLVVCPSDHVILCGVTQPP